MPGLASVLNAHVADMRLRDLSPLTITDRRAVIYRLARWLHPVSVLDASSADIAAWRASLTVGSKAVLTYAGHVREFYRFAVDAGYLDASPATSLRLPRPSRRLPRPVAEDDLTAALQCASPRVRPWLVLAGWAGFRACEIAYLRRENVIDTGPSPVLLVAEDATKGRRERIVEMSPFVLEELRLAGLPARGWVFRRCDGQRGPNMPWLVSRLANITLRDAGSAATLHMCRHRFLTQVYQQTRDIRLVQELAGHASSRTTDGYAGYSRAGAAEAVASLPVPARLRVVRSATSAGS